MAAPYRRWAAPLLAENERDPGAEHQTLADAAIGRDTDRGVQLLRDHIAYTTQMLLSDPTRVDAASDGAQLLTRSE